MAEIEPRVTLLEQQVSNVLTKLDMFITESREARQKFESDMREAREKHETDMREAREKHDADMREAREKHDADMRDMRNEMKTIQLNLDSKIDSMGKHVRNMSIVTIIGIAAMVVAVFLK